MDDLLEQLIAASRTGEAEQAVGSLLRAFVSDPDAAAAQLPVFEDDDVILFEDEQVSIWYCRFPPGKSVPAHNHRMSATIAVIRGSEQNDIFTRSEEGILTLAEQIKVSPGEVVHLPADVIHAVSCVSDTASEALHVYLGALSQIDRLLFDTCKHEELAFTDEAYQRLTESVR